MLSKAGLIKSKEGDNIGKRLNERQIQRLTDLLNEANRAFGLNIRVFDIFGRSSEYDGLLNKNGEYAVPDEIIVKPVLSRWEDLKERSDNKDSSFYGKTDEELQGIFNRYKNGGIDISNVSALSKEERDMIDVIRAIEPKVIRYTIARASRNFVLNKWDTFNFDDSCRAKGAREYRNAMHNQRRLMTRGRDTPGKPYLRRVASTDMMSLVQANARDSVLQQMQLWDKDFVEMKHWGEAITIGAAIKKNLTEGETALFNSTSKLQDPTEAIRTYKNLLGDWSQEQRNEWLDFISKGVLINLARYNTSADYRNAGVVRIMNLTEELIYGGGR